MRFYRNADTARNRAMTSATDGPNEEIALPEAALIFALWAFAAWPFELLNEVRVVAWGAVCLWMRHKCALDSETPLSAPGARPLVFPLDWIAGLGLAWALFEIMAQFGAFLIFVGGFVKLITTAP